MVYIWIKKWSVRDRVKPGGIGGQMGHQERPRTHDPQGPVWEQYGSTYNRAARNLKYKKRITKIVGGPTFTLKHQEDKRNKQNKLKAAEQKRTNKIIGS